MAERRPILSLIAAAVRRTAPIVSEAPVVRTIRRKVHLAEFAMGRQTDTFSGCYANFAEAEAAAPPGPIGYDHDAMTGFYQPTADSAPAVIDPSDYAVLFWLRDALRPGSHVFDLGGYVGNAFYNYARYLDYPPDLNWTVCDVESVIRAGSELAQRQGATQLDFTQHNREADGADILLAAGSLQYLEEGSLHQLLRSLGTRPRHVIVQRTPLHESRSFVTLQVMVPPTGPVFCPYTVAARQPFIDGLQALGYRLFDSWTKPRALVVPLHSECHVSMYSGLYFRAIDA